MSQLLIEVHNPEDEALILALSARLNARVITPEEASVKKDRFLQILQHIAEKGGVGESFGDPSEWQREIRSWDRVLDGREE